MSTPTVFRFCESSQDGWEQSETFEAESEHEREVNREIELGLTDEELVTDEELKRGSRKRQAGFLSSGENRILPPKKRPTPYAPFDDLVDSSFMTWLSGDAHVGGGRPSAVPSRANRARSYPPVEAPTKTIPREIQLFPMVSYPPQTPRDVAKEMLAAVARSTSAGFSNRPKSVPPPTSLYKLIEEEEEEEEGEEEEEEGEESIMEEDVRSSPSLHTRFAALFEAYLIASKEVRRDMVMTSRRLGTSIVSGYLTRARVKFLGEGLCDPLKKWLEVKKTPITDEEGCVSGEQFEKWSQTVISLKHDDAPFEVLDSSTLLTLKGSKKKSKKKSKKVGCRFQVARIDSMIFVPIYNLLDILCDSKSVRSNFIAKTLPTQLDPLCIGLERARIFEGLLLVAPFRLPSQSSSYRDTKRRRLLVCVNAEALWLIFMMHQAVVGFSEQPVDRFDESGNSIEVEGRAPKDTSGASSSSLIADYCKVTASVTPDMAHKNVLFFRLMAFLDLQFAAFGGRLPLDMFSPDLVSLDDVRSFARYNVPELDELAEANLPRDGRIRDKRPPIDYVAVHRAYVSSCAKCAKEVPELFEVYKHKSNKAGKAPSSSTSPAFKVPRPLRTPQDTPRRKRIGNQDTYSEGPDPGDSRVLKVAINGGFKPCANMYIEWPKTGDAKIFVAYPEFGTIVPEIESMRLERLLDLGNVNSAAGVGSSIIANLRAGETGTESGVLEAEDFLWKVLTLRDNGSTSSQCGSSMAGTSEEAEDGIQGTPRFRKSYFRKERPRENHIRNATTYSALSSLNGAFFTYVCSLSLLMLLARRDSEARVNILAGSMFIPLVAFRTDSIRHNTHINGFCFLKKHVAKLVDVFMTCIKPRREETDALNKAIECLLFPKVRFASGKTSRSVRLGTLPFFFAVCKDVLLCDRDAATPMSFPSPTAPPSSASITPSLSGGEQPTPVVAAPSPLLPTFLPPLMGCMCLVKQITQYRYTCSFTDIQYTRLKAAIKELESCMGLAEESMIDGTLPDFCPVVKGSPLGALQSSSELVLSLLEEKRQLKKKIDQLKKDALATLVEEHME